MELILLVFMIVTLAVVWTLLDEDKPKYKYEAIDKVENDEKAVILYKKTKIKNL